MTFLERVLSLINENGITKNKMLKDLGLGANSIVDWTNRGTIPGGETLSKIAAYFNVTTDYLLCLTDDPTPPNEKNTDEISDEDIMFALLDGDVEEITDAMFAEVKWFAQAIRDKKRQENERP